VAVEQRGGGDETQWRRRAGLGYPRIRIAHGRLGRLAHGRLPPRTDLPGLYSRVYLGLPANKSVAQA
jgi:hypothetical protein